MPLRVSFFLICAFCASTCASAASAPEPPPEGLCNALPDRRPSLSVVHKSLTSLEFVAKVAADPAYAVRLANPIAERPLYADDSPIFAYLVDLTYPPLEDVAILKDRLVQTGEFNSVIASLRTTDSRVS